MSGLNLNNRRQTDSTPSYGKADGRADFIWKACKLYTIWFRFFPQTPLYFDAKIHRLKLLKSLPKLFMWFVSVYCNIGGIQWLSKTMQMYFIMFVSQNNRGRMSEDIIEFSSAIQLASIGITFLCSGGTPVLGFLMLLFRKTAAQSCNQIFKLEELLERRWKERGRGYFVINLQQHLVSWTLQSASIFAIVLTPVVSIWACYQNVDPLYFLLKIVLKINLKSIKQFNRKLAMWTIRVLVLNTAATDILRHLLATALVFIGMLWIINCCVFLIEQEFKDAQSLDHQTKAIRMYRMLHISLNGIREAQATVGLALAGGVGFGLVMLIFLTLRFHDKVTFNVYIILPVATAVVLLVVYVTMPQIIMVSDMSKEMIRNWKATSTNLYLKRVNRSLRPINMFLGFKSYNFLLLDREFKVLYYSSILDYTTMLLMSYSPD